MKKAAVSSILVAAVLLAVAVIAEAQQPKKVPRIGYLSQVAIPALNPRSEAFRQGLRDLGYIEGKNILVEYRYAEGKNERDAKPCGRTRATQSRCPCPWTSTSDPRSQAGDQDDPYCHGDDSGSGRDWDSR